MFALAVILIGFCVFEATTLQGASNTYDEGVYWQSLRAISSGHPLFTSVFSSQPPLFLLSIFPIYLVGGQTLAAARLAIVLFGAVGVAAAWQIGRRFGGAFGGVLASVLLASDPIYVAGTHRLDAEVPMLAFALVAVVCAEASTSRTKGRKVLIVLVGILCTLAVLIKFFAVVAFVPIIIYIAAPGLNANIEYWSSAKKISGPIVVQMTKDLGILCVSVLGTLLAVLLPFIDRLDRIFDQVVAFHIAAGMITPYRWQDAAEYVWGVEWSSTTFKAAVVSTIVLALLPRRNRVVRILPIVFWTILSFGELVQQRPLIPHHFVILSPLIAITLGSSVALLGADAFRAAHDFRFRRSEWRVIRMLVGVAFLLLVLVSAGRDIQRSYVDVRESGAATINPTQQAMINSLRANVSARSWVVSDDQYIVSLADRAVPPELVDTSLVRIQSGYLTTQQLENIIVNEHVAAILFSTGYLSKLPGFQYWVEHHYTLVDQFDQAQFLYVLGLAGSPSSTLQH